MKKIVFIIIIGFSAFGMARAQQNDDRHSEARLEAQAKARQLARILTMDTQPTTNQNFYDVKHYELNLTIDVTGEQIRGAVTILAQVVQQAINQMDVNLLSSMAVDAVKMNNTSLQFQRPNDLIRVTLDRTYQPGELFQVTIDYHGRPSQSGFGAFGFDTHNNQPMIWTLSEPFGARNWWPCKDFPIDKADSVDIKVTVPENLMVAANGTLRSVSQQSHQKTYWWHESYPITTYLVSLAIHPYYVYADYYHYSPTDSMEVRFFVFPDQVSTIRSAYAKTVRMIEIFANIFGEYPFLREKYGHAQFLGGANMEHQTITSLVSRSEGTIVHELAHQWWGDYITCQDFHHIWLNEGFATYSEALYYEREYGKEEFWQEVLSNQYFGPGTIYVQDLSDVNTIFNYGRSYQKASWVLHMLRHVVGDEKFFEILRAFYNESRFRFGTATTEDFQALCEAVSGKKLDRFFRQWIYEEYYPSYTYSWRSIPSGSNYEIQLDIQQTQTNTIFWMPIDVTITTAAGDTTVVVWDSLASQTFHFTLQSTPLTVELDKHGWILKQVQEPLIQPSFDQGILLVNGVSWDTYGSEIRLAYQNRAFWGSFPIAFWDCFPMPMGGYPATLPTPLGHGRVPSEILGRFSTIIWVGNNYDGDLNAWKGTSIYEYLRAGGNLLLLTRWGQDFITENLRQYLGITWAENAQTKIGNCLAVYPGLTDMSLIGEQTYNAVFSTELSSTESTLLFKETVSFGIARGLGAWRKPATGGTWDPRGGQFVFISGRPYRYNAAQLKTNVEFILANFFQEARTEIGSTAEQPGLPARYALQQNYPNPFNSATAIEFQVPERTRVKLEIFDLLGRRRATLVNEELSPGTYRVRWDARGVAAGVYFCQFSSDTWQETRKMVLLP